MSLPIEHRIAIVGPEGVVSGFRALGVHIYPANTGADALAQIEKLKAITVDDSKPLVYAVVCVIEEVLHDVAADTFDQLVRGNLPAVVILPGPQGSAGQAEARLKRLAEQAVGAPLW